MRDDSTLEDRLPVLVVDDEPLVAKATMRTLIHCDHTFETAKNGVEAVEKAQATRYGLIIMDVNMPNKNGYDATKEIRDYEKQHGLPPTPILGVTSTDAQACLEAGMDDQVDKPFDRAILLEKVAALYQPEIPRAE